MTYFETSDLLQFCLLSIT